MKINPVNNVRKSRTGTLQNMDATKIKAVVGFNSNVDDDPDRVVNSWGFEIDGENYGIWDYRESHKHGEYSTFGDADVLTKLFGENYSS